MSDSDNFEEDRDSIKEKASRLKQLVLEPELNRSDVNESLEGLKIAYSALKTKMQQEQNRQQPVDLNLGDIVESIPAK